MRTGLGAFPFSEFNWFGLPSHGVFFSFGPWFVPYLRLTHVSVSRYLPCRLVNAGLIEFKKKKKKKKKKSL